MEASRIVPFPAPEGLSIRVDRDRIVLERLVVHDPGLAAFVAERPEAERPGLLDRAIKIGLVALQDAGVTINVDAVRREFDGFLRQTEAAKEKAATALGQTLRANFAAGYGRLPRPLAKFLGDRGALRTSAKELSTGTCRGRPCVRLDA